MLMPILIVHVPNCETLPLQVCLCLTKIKVVKIAYSGTSIFLTSKGKEIGSKTG